MTTSTISSKYQIVIPKQVRRQLGLQVGQKVNLKVNHDNTLTLEVLSPLAQLQQKYHGLWQDDPVDYVRQQRQDWGEK